MQTAMESIKSIVDVNTILGDPVETPDGSVVVPVSRISLGFAAGGTEYETEESREAEPSFPSAAAAAQASPSTQSLSRRRSGRSSPVACRQQRDL